MLAAVVAGILVVVTATACSLQRMFIYPRWVISEADQRPPGEHVEVLHLECDGVKVEAWLIAAPTASEQNPSPLAVFAHGNGELIDQWQDRLNGYPQRGISLLLVEYRGYGRTSGSPSQKSIVGDFVQAIDTVTARPEIDGDKLILHGRSLGGGVAAQVAAKRTPIMIVLESTFTSVADVAWQMWVPKLLILDPYRVRDVIAKATYPVLIMHGDTDTIIDVSHAKKNATAVGDRGELVIFPGLNHNDFMAADQYWTAIDRTLKRARVDDRLSGTDAPSIAPETGNDKTNQ